MPRPRVTGHTLPPGAWSSDAAVPFPGKPLHAFPFPMNTCITHVNSQPPLLFTPIATSCGPSGFATAWHVPQDVFITGLWDVFNRLFNGEKVGSRATPTT